MMYFSDVNLAIGHLNLYCFVLLFCNKEHTYTRGNDYDQWSQGSEVMHILCLNIQ